MVERGPEKAGVGGSIPSLATTFIDSDLAQTHSRMAWDLFVDGSTPSVVPGLRWHAGRCHRCILSESAGTGLPIDSDAGNVHYHEVSQAEKWPHCCHLADLP